MDIERAIGVVYLAKILTLSLFYFHLQSWSRQLLNHVIIEELLSMNLPFVVKLIIDRQTRNQLIYQFVLHFYATKRVQYEQGDI